ncbi:MAG: type III-B CRISPR-associated protein Cas10/Cmr2, partial [Candidatus Xenobia bacterium]
QPVRQGFGMNLLLLTLGPVQDFIASARRCRDLWFGSWLLSELSKAAARAVASPATTLIFPAVDDEVPLRAGSELNVANKILARVEDVESAVQAAQRAVRERLLELWENTRRTVRLQDLVDWDRARLQVDDLVEFYWASVRETSDYSEDRARLEAIMGARKNTRNFASVTWGAAVDKSSLDGLRESVIQQAAFKSLEAAELRRGLGIRPGERLCGVGLLKRHGARGDSGERVFSTSHVAAMPWIQGLTARDQPAVRRFFERLREIGVSKADLGSVPYEGHPVFENYDGHVLFEERLFEYMPREAAADARSALKGLLQEVRAGSPLPYYAVLLADGDRMGQAIDRQTSVDAHRKLSRQLSEFASQAARLALRFQASLIYSGGDDVLALVPLHTAIPFSRELAATFTTTLSKFGTQTLSVGLAVSHHLQPLEDSLTLARSAERLAKTRRNALAIMVSKRSGSVTSVFGHWGVVDVAVEHWVDQHVADAVPDGAAYELRRLADTLGSEASGELLMAETRRILARKRAKHGEGVMQSTDIESIVKKAKTTQDLRSVADQIIISRLLADAVVQARRGREVLTES